MSDKKYGSYICLKCGANPETAIHDNCNYEAVWIYSPEKEEIAQLQAQLKALTKERDELQQLLDGMCMATMPNDEFVLKAGSLSMDKTVEDL